MSQKDKETSKDAYSNVNCDARPPDDVHEESAGYSNQLYVLKKNGKKTRDLRLVAPTLDIHVYFFSTFHLFLKFSLSPVPVADKIVNVLDNKGGTHVALAREGIHIH